MNAADWMWIALFALAALALLILCTALV